MEYSEKVGKKAKKRREFETSILWVALGKSEPVCAVLPSCFFFLLSVTIVLKHKLLKFINIFLDHHNFSVEIRIFIDSVCHFLVSVYGCGVVSLADAVGDIRI